MNPQTVAKSQAPAIILGSSSPRRKDLLSVVGLSFEVLAPGIDERIQPHETPHDYVLRNAQEKGHDVAGLLKPRLNAYPRGCIIISADTIVVLENQVLEKPRDQEHATSMLRQLSGRAHTVFSGVHMQSLGVPSPEQVSFVTQTEVLIKPLSSAEIAAYVATGEPLDKAGAYAAQGIGSYMVKRINGSYANVVGLPIADVVEHLECRFAYPLFG